MKNFKGFAFGLVLGLGLAISSMGFAQTITQDDKQKAGESCCAMSSCCGDSCAMKHDSKTKSAMDHKGGCCCCADSCETKMKDKEKVN